MLLDDFLLELEATVLLLELFTELLDDFLLELDLLLELDDWLELIANLMLKLDMLVSNPTMFCHGFF